MYVVYTSFIPLRSGQFSRTITFLTKKACNRLCTCIKDIYQGYRGSNISGVDPSVFMCWLICVFTVCICVEHFCGALYQSTKYVCTTIP